MTAQSAAAAPTDSSRRNSLLALLAIVAQDQLLVLGGLLVSALTLAVTLEFPHVARDLRVELCALVVCYVAGVLLTVQHTRRRRPERCSTMLRLFVLAFILRIVCSCGINSYLTVYVPSFWGNATIDTRATSLAGRIAVFGLTHEDYGARHEYHRLNNSISRHNVFDHTVVYLAKMARRPWMAFSTFLTPIVSILLFGGYSSVAIVLPYVMLGAFLPVQAWLLASRLHNQRSGWFVAGWMALAPNLLYHSISIDKDLASTICVLYLVDLVMAPAPGARTRRWEYLLLAAFACFHRPFLIPFGILLAGYAAARARIPAPLRPRWDWTFVIVLVLGGGLMHMWAGAHTNYEEVYGARPHKYLANIFLSPLLLPLLRWVVTPEVFGVFLESLQALVWPVVAGLLLAAIALRDRLRLERQAALVVTVMSFLVLSSVRMPFTIVSTRFRLPIDPLLLLFASAAFDALRRLPVQQRMALTSRVLGVVIAIGAMQLMSVLVSK